MKPRYLQDRNFEKLKANAEQAASVLTHCTLCPRSCKVNRTSGETGFCQTGQKALVASYNPHFGEESPLVGRNGSGTIFFAQCNLKCNFCQNYDISHQSVGCAVNHRQLAEIMLSLQSSGCHNINFVSPSHVVPQILSALVVAIDKGLNIPLVYNSSGYDSVATLTLLDPIIDIYMPDFKFWDSKIAASACQAKDYSQVARDALKEMHRQVGDLAMDTHDLAYQGLLVRHLVLPKGLAGTSRVMTFIATQISTNTYVNVMSQYRPCGEASQTAGLERSITTAEFKNAIAQTRQAGITRLDKPRRSFAIW